MCSDPKKKVSSTEVFMEVDAQKKQAAGDGFYNNTSLLLELSAVNDLTGFKRALEEEGRDVNKSCFWYGRRIGSKKMGFEERTPLMIASMFGSVDVLNFILQTGLVVDVNRAYGSDGATALHCAAAGGSSSSVKVVKLLIGSLADINCVDAQGNRPCDVIPLSLSSSSKSRRKALEVLLKGECAEGQASLISDPELGLEEVSLNKKADVEVLSSPTSSDGSGTEKKEYPVDPSLPDIKNGIYSTDEFRMYIFKVKPCSRAYSHDWTECPFVHPGENARRRDPRKYHYSCVPCPDFRKGTCNKGDACEYAHGIFECWLHPAQYRTRLCKDEINCSRRVCFFAHKPEELRPVYASTGSGMPSPRSMSSIGSPFDMASSLSPLALGSPSVLLPSVSTPPMTPTSSSSPMAGGNMWQNQFNVITPPPNLQLPGSRLKTALNARDVELRAELQDLENQRRKQQLLEELAALSSPRSWNSGSFSNGGALATTHGSLKPSNLDDMFGSSLDATFLAQSPTGMQIRQNLGQQTRANYSSTLCSSPTRGSSSSLGLDPSGVSNPRLAAFAKRSQSFIDRSAMANRLSGFSSPAPSSPTVMGSPRKFPEWGSPDGKLDWGLHGEELSKLRKSASFGFHNSGSHGNAVNSSLPAEFGKEPDLSWVQSIAKDAPMGKSAELGFDDELKQRRQYRLNSGGSEMIPSWAEQLYKEQEQTVA